MAGDWIGLLARRAVRAETFLLVVTPAIADLQLEARTRSRWVIARSYVGVWMAVCGGFCNDVVIVSRNPEWIDEAATMAGLLLLQLAYYGGFISVFTIVLNLQGRFSLWDMVLNLLREGPITTAVIVVVALVAAAAPIIGLLWPRRESPALEAPAQPD